jgi:hypothetical protein
MVQAEPGCELDDSCECIAGKTCGNSVEATVYFISFLFIGSLVMINLFIAVILDTFADSLELQKREKDLSPVNFKISKKIISDISLYLSNFLSNYTFNFWHSLNFRIQGKKLKHCLSVSYIFSRLKLPTSKCDFLELQWLEIWETDKLFLIEKFFK